MLQKISISILTILFLSSCTTTEQKTITKEVPNNSQEQEASKTEALEIVTEETSTLEEAEPIQDESLAEFENILIDLLESTE